jgi:hypothetical protein
MEEKEVKQQEEVKQQKEVKLLSQEEAIATYIANGATLMENLHIERAAQTTILNADSETKNNILTLTVKETVKRMVADDKTGEYSLKEVHHFVVSQIALLNILSKNEVFTPFVRKLQQQPKLLEMLLPGCRISVLSIPVTAGKTYTNYFNNKETVIENNSIFFEPTAIVAGKFAEQQLANAAQAVLMQALLQ